MATNELESDKLSDEEALKAYKEQQYAERGGSDSLKTPSSSPTVCSWRTKTG